MYTQKWNTNLARITFAIVALLSTIYSSPLFAGTVDKVKGKNVLIRAEEGEFTVGAKLSIYDENGKKRALVKVNKIKGKKLVAKIVKGKAKPGWDVRGGKVNPTSGQPTEVAEAGDRDTSATKKAMGFTFGTSTDSMKLTFGDNTSLTIAGAATNFRFVYDLNPSPNWGMRFGAGMEQFSAQGTAASAVCNGSTDCYLRLNYIVLDFELRKKFNNFWLAGGFSYFIHGDGETTAVDAASIKDNMVGLIELGYDINVGKSGAIPLIFGLSIMPPSDTVSTTIMALKTGYVYSW